MSNSFLYASTVLIWGSTWIAITFQLGTVDPSLSVTYRFALASLMLIVFCVATRRRMRFSIFDHFCMASQGVLLFGLNYLLFYVATLDVTSGLLAVIFSTVIAMNILNGALFLGSRVHARVLAGASTGLVGIGLVFWPDLVAFDLSDGSIVGLVLGIIATYSASLGNILSARNQRSGLPVIQTNAYGMAYGALLMFGYALATGAELRFDASSEYVVSLLYLALFGSVLAFGSYLTLLGRIGADRAAYATLLFPLVALTLSTLLEGYQWSALALVGMGLVLGGNITVLTGRRSTVPLQAQKGAPVA